MASNTDRQTRPRIILCGGRDLINHVAFGHAMDVFMQLHGMPRIVIEGGAKGADTLAREWAKYQGIQLIEVPANWNREGLSAGPKRNQLMLDLLEPDMVVAFPGGPGTADMVRRAKAAGVFVYEV